MIYCSYVMFSLFFHKFLITIYRNSLYKVYVEFKHISSLIIKLTFFLVTDVEFLIAFFTHKFHFVT